MPVGGHLVAGVDSSTQSCKVVIRDLASGALVRAGRAPHPAGTEVDPAAWWAALQTAITAAGGLEDVAAISVAAQQHGLVALDADGAVVRPALLWNDTRSAGAAAELVAEVGAGEFARRVCLVPVASMTLTKLRWLRDSEPDNAARVAAVALPHDWLSWRLRGYGPQGQSPLGPVLEELKTDRSDASGTAYFSPVSNEYDRELLARGLGRDDVVLPRVLGPAEAAGQTPDGVLVGPGAGDNAAAALALGVQGGGGRGDAGSGAHGDDGDACGGNAIVSIGTSGTVFAATSQPARDESGTVTGFADAAGAYLPLITTLNAARVLDSTAKLLSTDFAGLDALALGATPGAAGVVLLPYFEGERTPNLPHARASLHGLSIAASTRENVARAAVEGMLCGLADGLDAIRHSAGVAPRRLLLIGGGAASAAVQRIAAEVFDLAVAVPEPGEYVADGAAVQAAWALTGERPDWPLSLSNELEPDHQPLIRDQYRRYAAMEE